jgi:hypothetical protein
MLFIKVYKFDGDFDKHKEEINFAIDDFYREFSIFPNMLYTSLNGILNIDLAVFYEVKLNKTPICTSKKILSEFIFGKILRVL